MPKVKLNNKECTLCGNCIDLCPMEVFKKENDKIAVVKEDECIGCKSCEIQCPAQCIKIED